MASPRPQPPGCAKGIDCSCLQGKVTRADAAQAASAVVTLAVALPEVPMGWDGDQAFVLGGWGPCGVQQPGAIQTHGPFPLGFSIPAEEGSNGLCLPAAALGMLLVCLIRERKK